MGLNLGTLAIALGITMVVRAAATTVQYAINREYRGIGLWAIANILVGGRVCRDAPRHRGESPPQ
jgi:hypothetical protein